MKLSVLILVVLLSGVMGAAQETCLLKSKKAYAVFNLQLGMSPVEANNALGRQLEIKIKKNGERTFFQNFIDKKSPQALPGVRALYLRFFDQRLYQIEVFYEKNQDGSQTLAEFTNYLLSAFDLPENAFQIKKGIVEIKCAETSIVADYVLNPRIEITDETIRAQVEESRKQKKK